MTANRVAPWSVAFVVLGLSFASSADTAVLESRLRALEGDVDVGAASAALEQAERALAKSGARAKEGDPGGSARARAIADAALTLAERQVARERTRRALFATRQRLLEVRAKVSAEREAVERLLRQRAEVARQEDAR